MIVFKYQHAGTVKICQNAIKQMELPGEPTEEVLDENSTLVWKGDRFLAIHYKEDNRMELYGTKNTNAVNYFIMRYPKLDWDTYSVIRSKRWGGKR